MGDRTVSVVITTYYRNRRLRSALQSVREQTYEPVEVVVVDGSGTEHARSVVEEWEGVRYAPQDSNEGPQADRSLGAEHTSGTYVQFLDDDDRLYPKKLQKQVALLERRPEVGVAYSGFRFESGRELFPAPEKRGHVLAFALTNDLAPCQISTMLIRRETLNELMPLSNHHGADDVGMKIELAMRTEFDFVDEILVERGEPPERRGASWVAIDGLYEVLDRYDPLYRDNPELRAEMMAQIKWKTAARILKDHRWSVSAIRAALASLWYHPEPSLKDVGKCLLSLGGQPGLKVGTAVWWRIVRRNS